MIEKPGFIKRTGTISFIAETAAQDGTLASGRDLALLIGAGISESVELSQKLSQDFGIPPEKVPPALEEIRKSFDPNNF